MLFTNNFDRVYSASLDAGLFGGNTDNIFRIDLSKKGIHRRNSSYVASDFVHVPANLLSQVLYNVSGFVYRASGQNNKFYPINPSGWRTGSTGGVTYYYMQPVNSIYYTYVMFGTGTTAPTKNDLDLESPQNYTCSIAVERFMSVSDGVLTVDTKLSISNNDTQNNMEFQELGLFCGIPQMQPVDYDAASATSSSNFYSLAMLARHVFDEPITIPPSERATIVLRASHRLGSSTDFPDIARRLIPIS